MDAKQYIDEQYIAETYKSERFSIASKKEPYLSQLWL